MQAYQDGQELTSEFAIVATVSPGHTIAEVEAAANAELERLKVEPPTPEEVERAQNTFEARLMRSLESISEFGGRADRLNLYNIYTGNPGFMSEDYGRYAGVDTAAVSNAARRFLGTGRVVVELVPGAEVSIEPNPVIAAEAARARLARQIPASSASGDGAQDETNSRARTAEVHDGRESLPPAAAEPTFYLPPIQRARLSNGMQLLLVEKHDLPMVNLHVVFPAGRGHDGASSPGLAEMTAAVWDEGTARRSAEDIASELGILGAYLSVSVDWDTTSVRLFTLKRHLPKALDITADVLREPTFPEEELQRQRVIALGRLEQIRNEPTALASLAAAQLLYGFDHPYGHPAWGNAAAIEKLEPADLKRFHAAYMWPETAAVIVVGDVALAEVEEQLNAALRRWQAAAPPPAALDFTVPKPKPTRLVLIDKPQAAQSVIYLALVGERRNTPDFFAQNVMNAVLGGQFSSRLNMNLREQKGYTYGARTVWDWRVNERGPLLATASVQTAVTAAALSEFLKEFQGMVAERPIDEEELDFCKKFLARGYSSGFESPSRIAMQLETLFAYGLPDDYFNTVVPGVRAVTVEGAMRVAKKYLALDCLAIVVVGDRAAIEPQLRELPVGRNLAVYSFDDDFRLNLG